MDECDKYCVVFFLHTTTNYSKFATTPLLAYSVFYSLAAEAHGYLSIYSYPLYQSDGKKHDLSITKLK